jgi:hypothetical protein
MEANELRYRGSSGNETSGRTTADASLANKQPHAKDISEGGTSISTESAGVMYGRTPKGDSTSSMTAHPGAQ